MVCIRLYIFTIIDILNTLKSPFYYRFSIICFQYYQISKIEKEYLGFKKSIFIEKSCIYLFGILGGIITTVAFLYLGVVAIPMDYMYILFVVIVLSFFNPRFMCFLLWWKYSIPI